MIRPTQSKDVARFIIVFVGLTIGLVEGFGPAQLTPDVFREKTIFGVLRDAAKQHPDEVLGALEEFVRKVNPRPGAFDDDDSIALFNDTTPVNDCYICRLLATLILQVDYDTLEPLVIQLCVAIADALEMRSDPLCEGSIKLQLPYIHRALDGIRSLQPAPIFCENINANCILSSTVVSSPNSGGISSARNQRIISDQEAKEKTMETRQRPTRKRKRSGNSSAGIRSDAVRVVQLTDIHIEPNYAPGSPTECGLPVCCLDKWTGTGRAGELGDFHCNLPRSTIELFLERVKDFNPDIILFSGDIPPHTVWDETEESQLRCTELLVESLSRNLTGHDVYPIIGNHEMYPTNLFSFYDLSYTSRFISNWTEIWEPLAKFTDNGNGVQNGGYYTKLLRPGLRLLVFNSNYMYTFNWYNSLNFQTRLGLPPTPSEATLMDTFMRQQLTNARIAGEKVILVGHHPPGGADYIISRSRLYERLVLDFSDIIVLQPTGHTHTDEFRMIYDESKVPKSVVYVSPSMTSNGKKNPSMRIFYLDPDSFDVLDYEQYFLDIRPLLAAISKGQKDIDWKDMITKLYSAKDEYDLPDLSPESWDGLLKRFETDGDLLTKHRRHSNAAADNIVSYCGERCRHLHICRMKNCNYDKYQECVDELPLPTLPPTTLPNTGTPAPPTPSRGSSVVRTNTVAQVVTLLTGLTWVVCWVSRRRME